MDAALDTRAWAPFRRAYRAAVEVMRPAVDDVGQRRFAGGSVMRGLDELPWDGFTDALLPGWERSAAWQLTHHRNAEIARHRVVTRDRKPVIVDADTTRLADQLAISWLERRGLVLAQHLSGRAKAALTDTLRDAVLNNRSLEQVVRQASLHVGLHPQDREALRNMRGRLEKGGATERQVERRTEAYRKRLVKQRADLIAQTELVAARTAGKQQAWKILQEEGDLSRQATRRVVVGVCCANCQEMDGVTALVGQPYRTRRGVVWGPPFHPRCDCLEELARS